MKCQNENCTRTATQKNLLYFKDRWLCTFHANKLIKEGRIKRKQSKKTKE